VGVPRNGDCRARRTRTRLSNIQHSIHLPNRADDLALQTPGAASNKASQCAGPSCELTQRITPATASAARASAVSQPWQIKCITRPNTRPIPAIDPTVLQHIRGKVQGIGFRGLTAGTFAQRRSARGRGSIDCTGPRTIRQQGMKAGVRISARSGRNSREKAS